MYIKWVFSLRLFLILALISLPAASARAGTQTTTEVERYIVTAIWMDFDAQGNTIYTQLDIYDGFNIPELSGPGTELGLYRTVISPQGDFVYTDDSFFGRIVTTEPVFQTDPKLKSATLAPVTFEGSPRPYTIQVEWAALGSLASTSSAFKQARHIPTDQYQVKYEGETESREALATGSLNGQSLANPSVYAFLSRYITVTVSKGPVDPYSTAHPDYYAPTIEQGNKLMRGGEGSVAEATWVTQNPDGTTTELTLSIFDGYGYEYRLKYFFNGTDIALTRIVKDQSENYISLDNGGVFYTTQIFNISTNLDRAYLPPVQITICGFWERDEAGSCIDGEEMLIEAEWSGVDKLIKGDRFRFTQMTNCDDIDCWTTDFEHNFKVKVISSGESRLASATGSLNGASLGPSASDGYGQSAFLFSIKEYTIQYGGVYPLNVFPISLP